MLGSGVEFKCQCKIFFTFIYGNYLNWVPGTDLDCIYTNFYSFDKEKWLIDDIEALL